jgi:hypothetical protein
MRRDIGISSLLAVGTGSPESVPRCALCGEPLGIYEPLIQLDGEKIIRTSRAARPDLPFFADSSFHAGCFEERQELTTHS